MKIKKSSLSICVLVFAMLLLSGCLPCPNPYEHEYSSDAGFFSGIWHGLYSPFSLILSIFINVSFYEVKNTGWWYNFGFLIGLSTTIGVSVRKYLLEAREMEK